MLCKTTFTLLYLVVQVLFAPRIAGIYVAQLSLLSGPVDFNLSVRGKLPVMVTLQAVAENPSIEVSIFYLLIITTAKET